MPGRKVKRKAGDETVDGHPGESEKEQPGNASKRTKVALDDFDIEEMSDPDEGFTESTPQPPADLEPVVEELLEKPSTFKEAADVAAPPPSMLPTPLPHPSTQLSPQTCPPPFRPSRDGPARQPG